MKKTPTRLALEKAVRVFGGQVHTAEALGLRNYQTVQSWLHNRVPAEHCPVIERETTRLGQPVRCEELRPDIEWSVLRQAA